MENQEIIISAYCDCCDNQNSGQKENLQADGWYLGDREQFCPVCNEG